MNILQILLRFLKIGVIGFGGGSALIPVIRSELVENTGAMSEDEYLKHTVVANITPGALPVKLGATCGYQLSNPAGALLGAYAVTLPGAFFCVLIIALFSMMGQSAINYLNYASLGITVFIVFLLLSYVEKTVKTGNWKVNTAICVAAFALTGGKEVREIIEAVFGHGHGALGTPLLDISMINVMILSFYLIYFFQRARKSKFLAIGLILSAAYAALCGKLATRWQHAGAVKAVLMALILLSVAGLLFTGKKSGGEKQRLRLERPVLLTMALFLVAPVIPAAIGAAAGLFPAAGESVPFLGNILVSTVTSFGGGEAYVAVADSIFVQGGYVAADVFYSRVVPVANALPGPILIKIATSIGFVWGQGMGSTAEGVVLAATCMLLAVGACSAIALLVLNFYDALKASAFVLSLKQYILPVICGTLISTSLSMLVESMKITASYGFGSAATFVVMAACVVFTMFLHKKFHLNDLLLLIGWIVVSLGLLILIL